MTKGQKIFTGGGISTLIGIATMDITTRTYSNSNAKKNNIFFWTGVALAFGGAISMLLTVRSVVPEPPKKQDVQK